MRPLIVLALVFFAGCGTESKVVPASSGSTVAGEVDDRFKQIREFRSQRIRMYVEGTFPGENRFRMRSQEEIEREDSFLSISTQLKVALIQNQNVTLLDEQKLSAALQNAKRTSAATPIYKISIIPTEYGEGIEDSTAGSGNILTTIALLPWRMIEFWIHVYTGIPTEYSTQKRRGVVAFDVQLSDANSGRILESFSSRGTFQSEERKIGGMMSYNESSYAGSTLLQASRVAVGDATLRILKTINATNE